MKFAVEKTVNYWSEGSEYDWGVAKAMFKAKKYPYALFMGHLALEKLLKALVVKTTKEHAPYTHSLPALAERVGFEIPHEIKNRFVRFMEFYFESRYPEERMLFYEKCTKRFTEDSMKEIEGTFLWLKKKL